MRSGEQEHHDSLFAPNNAPRVALALEVLLGMNIFAIHVALLVFLIQGIGEISSEKSLLENAVERSRLSANLFARIYMLSGIVFFTLFFVISVWLYRGTDRWKWSVGGLGVMMHAATLVTWKRKSASEFFTGEYWYIYGVFLILSFLMIFYVVINILPASRPIKVLISIGIFLTILGMPICYVIDPSGITAPCCEGVGILLCACSYSWGRRGDNNLNEEREPLLNNNSP
jgi:hypothetical protein